MIYFLQQKNGGPIKIGFTSNGIKSRISQIQTGCPEKLILIGCIDGDAEDEKALHSFLIKHKVRGEWFHPHPIVISCIFSLIVGIDISTVKEKSHIFNKMFTSDVNKNKRVSTIT